MAQLMPLPLTVSCFSKIQIGFTFLVPAHPGSPGQRAVKRVCVCVYNMPSLTKFDTVGWVSETGVVVIVVSVCVTAVVFVYCSMYSVRLYAIFIFSKSHLSAGSRWSENTDEHYHAAAQDLQSSFHISADRRSILERAWAD